MKSNDIQQNDLSELEAVDKAIGAHIVSCLNCLDSKCGSSHYRRFLQRNSHDQVYRGEEQDPKAFVRALKSHQKQEKDSDRRLNKVELPLIYYYRSLDMMAADPDAGSVLQSAIGWDDDLLQSYELAMAKVLLNYKVCFVAPDKATVQRLAMAWYFYVMNKKKGNHRFAVRYNIAGNDFDLPCIIQDPQTFSATNVSQEKIEGRLFALEVTLDVLTPILYGHSVNVIEPRIELAVGLLR